MNNRPVNVPHIVVVNINQVKNGQGHARKSLTKGLGKIFIIIMPVRLKKNKHHEQNWLCNLQIIELLLDYNYDAKNVQRLFFYRELTMIENFCV